MRALRLTSLAGALLVAGLLLAHAPLGVALLAHVVLSAVLGALCRRADPAHPLGAARLAVLSLCFPIVGGTLGVRLVSPREVTPLFESLALEPLSEAPAPWTGGETPDFLKAELSVCAYIDQLRFGVVALKRQAAEALAGMEGPEGVVALRSVLVDPDADARLFASLALLRMEERFAAEIKASRDHSARDPGPEASLRLALAARRYAASGLTSGKALQHCWLEVARSSERALAVATLPGHQLEAGLHLAAARLALGDPSQALIQSRAASALAPRDERALLAQCEALFALGSLPALREVAERLARVAPPHTSAYAIATYWRTHGH